MTSSLTILKYLHSSHLLISFTRPCSIINTQLHSHLSLSSPTNISPNYLPNLQTHQDSMGGTSPCASCKLLRRRCAKDCVFAPYFPSDDPHKFAIVHKVFGASNVSKMLQVTNTNALFLFFFFIYNLSRALNLINMHRSSRCINGGMQ